MSAFKGDAQSCHGKFPVPHKTATFGDKTRLSISNANLTRFSLFRVVIVSSTRWRDLSSVSLSHINHAQYRITDVYVHIRRHRHFLSVYRVMKVLISSQRQKGRGESVAVHDQNSGKTPPP
ncbi:hypothetical protein Trydic_g8789 [Trypoxylus dichotomus]